jgi:hypothetical protein
LAWSGSLGRFSQETLLVPVRYAEAGGMIAATIAAAYLVFERPAKHQPADQESKTMTAVLLGMALLLGFLIALTDSHSGWTSDGASMAGLALGAAAFSVVNRNRPWLWALGVYASIPVFYSIAPPHNPPWILSGPLPFGMNNRVAQSVDATIAFLLVAVAGAYLGVLIRKVLKRRLRSADPSSAN